MRARFVHTIALILLAMAAPSFGATYISVATGNFTATSTWAAVDSASELDSTAANTALSTSYTYSNTFVPAAAPIDGVAVHVASRAASPTGTITVQLYDNTTSTQAFAVTLNVSDLNGAADSWYVFQVASPITPNGTDAYKVGALTSSASQVNLYSSTATNWSRELRLTSAASARAANDKFMVTEACTAAGTCTTFTVTMDETANTSYGPTVSGGPPCGMTVNNGSTLTFNAAASANPYLRLKGQLCVNGGATLLIGDPAGTCIPSSSTAILEFAPVAANDSYLNVKGGGTYKTCGVTKTSETIVTSSVGGYVSTLGTYVTAQPGSQSFVGLSGTININGSPYTIAYVSDATHLVTTASAGTLNNVLWQHPGTATGITVADTTGWLANDSIALAGTSALMADTETVQIATVDSGTHVTLSSAAAKTHLAGPAPIVAEVINLTRNVKVRGLSASGTGVSSVSLANGSTVDSRNTEYQYLLLTVGHSTAGSVNLDHTSHHDQTSSGYLLTMPSVVSTASVTLTHVVVDNGQGCLTEAGGAGLSASYLSCFYYAGSGAPAFWSHSNAVSGPFDHITVVGGCNEVTISTGFASLSNLTVHSGGNCGLSILLSLSGQSGGTISNVLVYHAGSTGLQYAPVSGSTAAVIFANVTSFGNAGPANLYIYGGALKAQDTFVNLTVAGSIYNASGAGIASSNGSSLLPLRFVNATLGSLTPPYTLHTGADFWVPNSTGLLQVLFDHSTFASGTAVGNPSLMVEDPASSWVKSHDHNGIAGNDKTWYRSGTIETDFTPLPGHAAPYEKLTSTSASLKLPSGRHCAALQAGTNPTWRVYVYKSAAYNGNQPRLIVIANDGAGVTTDTVIATASGSTGAWEMLSAPTGVTLSENTVLCAYVDIDGTAGTVDIDDWSVS